MDTKKIAAAVVVGYIVLLALSYLEHQIWLMPEYRQHLDVWRPLDVLARKMWIMWVGQLIFITVFVWVYNRGVENKPWVGQGLRYGIAIALLAVVPGVAAEYVVYPVPYTLALKWMVAGGIQVIVLGLIVAQICQKPAR